MRLHPTGPPHGEVAPKAEMEPCRWWRAKPSRYGDYSTVQDPINSAATESIISRMVSEP
jgi:hypothetical protein